MRVRQYVYFAVKSDVVSAAEMAVRIGLEPDEVTIQGSRSKEPLLPVVHAWKIVRHAPGATVDEMISHVVDRLEPVSAAIGELVAELNHGETGSSAVMQVVRYFDGEEGEEEDLRSPHPGLERLPGQHQLLGWHLDGRLLRFLAATGAELDVDEYG
ncbi:DUF4279 domain-containing protein [Nonomuraea sp. NN258]|uniref:DUF4279 domain-containing protein n=1 Tax=Nonomuraea antri TaxID=2730852 RepID=UPI0015687E7D|nr:DUF4279 domain-containing protein [Nonomuraea antri]NRQ39610.1 DUF4279 domain-containing protein [Nonomuraea antri]